MPKIKSRVALILDQLDELRKQKNEEALRAFNVARALGVPHDRAVKNWLSVTDAVSLARTLARTPDEFNEHLRLLNGAQGGAAK